MKRILTAVFSALLFILLLLPAAAAEEASAPTANRYNIMLVLDASGSLNSTDPRGYRFDAVNLFANLLPEEGNVVGGVVFSTDIDREVVPVHIGSQEFILIICVHEVIIPDLLACLLHKSFSHISLKICAESHGLGSFLLL